MSTPECMGSLGWGLWAAHPRQQIRSAAMMCPVVSFRLLYSTRNLQCDCGPVEIAAKCMAEAEGEHVVSLAFFARRGQGSDNRGEYPVGNEYLPKQGVH